MTIFAPTNSAFEKLPPHRFQALLADPESLRAVLLRHVTAGRLESSDLPEGPSTLITGAGEQVTIASLPLGVTLIGPFGSANVIDADVAASNGVIHVVDSIF